MTRTWIAARGIASLAVVCTVGSSVAQAPMNRPPPPAPAVDSCEVAGTFGRFLRSEVRGVDLLTNKPYETAAPLSDHPLIGTVMPAPSQGRPHLSDCAVDPLYRMFDQLAAHLQRGGIVLLGEVHDNIAHHRLRGRFPQALSDPTPAVFEHLRADQSDVLVRFGKIAQSSEYAFDRTARSKLAGEFFRAVDWADSGWPDAAIYEPLFRGHVFRQMLAGDPPKGAVRDVARQGLAALADGEAARLKLTAPLPDKLQAGLLDELEASHCGLMPRTAFGNMAVAQRYRDAHLAERVKLAADQHGSAVLFAGNGHLRTDRGVPYYLRQMTDKPILSVMLIEVEDGKTDPEAYVPRDPDGKPVADFVIFTPRAERKDPCDEMRAMMQRKK